MERHRTRWLLIFGFWTLLALLFLGQRVTENIIRGRPITMIDLEVLLIYQFTRFYAWGLVAPLIYALAQRFRLERSFWKESLKFHLPGGLGVALLHATLATSSYLGLGWWLGLAKAEEFSSLPTRILAGVYESFITYWVILGIYYTFDYYRKFRENELKASQLKEQLTHAQLQALKMQLHPHFLFNTLHSISALIYKDSEAADRMLTRLSDLLRLTLQNQGTQEVSLRSELEFLEKYLEIEKIRFRDRLAVEFQIDPNTLDAAVPNLILQPLVENAIRHGVAPRSAPGTIEIRSRRSEAQLALEVSDNGPGLSNDEKKGVGLSNTQARLQQLYGSTAHLILENFPNKGLTVRLTLPFRSTLERE
jgi:signal transduction histidine kinase